MREPREIVQFLRASVPLFTGFTDERLAELVAGSRTRSFEANEGVAHMGSDPSHFNVILSGTVSASVLGEGGERREIGRLSAGATFGEMSLMTGDKLLADFVAESRVDVLFIPVTLFQSVIIAQPGAVQHISQTIADRLRLLMAAPATAAAALRRSEDPYGLTLRGDRPEMILVVNCGSSSLKYAFFDTADDSRHAREPSEPDPG